MGYEDCAGARAAPALSPSDIWFIYPEPYDHGVLGMHAAVRRRMMIWVLLDGVKCEMGMFS